MNGDPCGRVDHMAYSVAGVYVAAHSVLGREKGYKFYPGSFGEYVDG